MKENEPMLLLVEDDPADAVLIQRSIQKVGIPAQVVHLKDGDEAVAYLSAETSKSGASMPFLVDRKSTRLNSSHSSISYAVFCLKKKNNEMTLIVERHRHLE